MCIVTKKPPPATFFEYKQVINPSCAASSTGIDTSHITHIERKVRELNKKPAVTLFDAGK